jgi:hypothetical protein
MGRLNAKMMILTPFQTSRERYGERYGLQLNVETITM